jgi:hypothetical protein
MNDTIVRRNLIAEAKYLRAHNYYILLMEYGSVTLTLDFAEAPTTEAHRSPTSEIFALIIKDLKEAIQVLPIFQEKQEELPSRSMHLLSKVYLARAGSATHKPAIMNKLQTGPLQLLGTRLFTKGTCCQLCQCANMVTKTALSRVCIQRNENTPTTKKHSLWQQRKQS